MTAGVPPAVAQDLAGRRGPALVLVRNDLEFVEALRHAAPHLEWTVLTKDTLKGWKANRLLSELRRRPYRAMVLQDTAGETARRRDLYRLMLLSSRARRRWLVGSGDGATAERVAGFRGWLGLVGAGVGEAASTLRAVLGAARLTRRLDRTPVPPAGAPTANRRVAVLRTDFWFGVKAGGSISHAVGVVRAMRSLGLEPRVWTTDPLPGLPQGVEQTPVLPDARPALLEDAAQCAFNHTFWRRARRALAAFDPGLVYHRHSLYSLAGLAAARALGVPLVLEVNASEVWARRVWSRLYFRRLAEWMERTAFRRADRLVLVSQALVRTVTEAGADPARVVVSPNGVELDRFSPHEKAEKVRRALEIPSDAVVCGFLGTFTRWHGVLFLAECIPALVRAEPRLHFLWIGDGDFRSEVAQRLQRAGVDAHNHFTGLVDPDRVPNHLAACDILLSPHLPFVDGSEFFGSPTKLFEYMAAGRPVVASNLGQIGSVVADGETGVLVPPGDGTAFAEAVLQLAHEPALRKSMGHAARARAESNYTWEANVRRALDGLVAWTA